jgi:poly-beta-hydroxyalkanoate depolymerase
MTDKEKAELILEGLDEYLQVNWNMKEFYIKGILKGFKKIKETDSND